MYTIITFAFINYTLNVGYDEKNSVLKEFIFYFLRILLFRLF